MLKIAYWYRTSIVLNIKSIEIHKFNKSPSRAIQKQVKDYLHIRNQEWYDKEMELCIYEQSLTSQSF